VAFWRFRGVLWRPSGFVASCGLRGVLMVSCGVLNTRHREKEKPVTVSGYGLWRFGVWGLVCDNMPIPVTVLGAGVVPFFDGHAAAIGHFLR